jgi:hypothetical protein
MPKRVVILGIGCLGGVVLLGTFLTVGTRVVSSSLERKFWPERLPGVRLEPARPFLAEDKITPDNAYYYIRQLTNWTDRIRGKRITEETKRFQALGHAGGVYPSLDAWLDKNRELVELCRKVADLESCQVATIISPEDLTPYIRPIPSLSKVFSFHAEKAAAESRWEDMLRHLKTSLRLSGHITRGGPLINHLVHYAGTAIACRSARRIALYHHPPDAVLERLIQLLRETLNGAEPFAEAMRYERLFALTCLEMVYRDPLSLSLLDDPETVSRPVPGGKIKKGLALGMLALLGSSPGSSKAHFDAVYSHLIDSSEKPYNPDRQEEAWASIVEKAFEKKWLMPFADPLGKITLALVLPAQGTAFEKSIVHAVELRGTMAVLALHRYRRGHNGQRPETLEDLHPGLLPEAATDEFSAGPSLLNYKRTEDGWIIYSVGPNQRNDGGRYNYSDPEDLNTHRDELDICFSSEEFEKSREWFLGDSGTKDAGTRPSDELR